MSLRLDEDALVHQILDGYASLPLSLRQKVSRQMKAKANTKAFTDVKPSEVDDFLASAVQVKTSPFRIKSHRKKMGVALTGLLATSYLYLCYEGWKTAGMASLQANKVTQTTLGPLLLYTPATDLQASRSAFFALQQQLGSLPLSLQLLSENVATLDKKIKDKKARCEHLQDIVEHVERYKLRQVDTLPNAIQNDLQRILLRNILEVPMSSSGPLLLQNSGQKKQQKKKPPPSLALLLGTQSTTGVALTTYETGVAEAWLQEWQTTGKMVKESMYRSILNGYLDEKRALWDATKESLVVLETERARLTGEKTQKQQRLVLRTLERPVKKEEIMKRTANVLTGKTKFKQQVKVKENVLLRQRLGDVPFSNTEYNLMGQCVLLCTILMATTGPFRWIGLFPSGFSEWLFSVTTATALVVKSSWQGNLVTFGSLLTEVFGLSLNYYTGVSSDFHVDSADQMLFVGILVLMTITYFGYYGVLLLQRLWGVDVRKMQREMARLQKELEQARRTH